MAIDATRGLPSFSEMYSAFKNRGGLADAITAGFQGFESGRAGAAKAQESAANVELTRAKAKEAMANANKDPLANMMDASLIKPNVSKEQWALIEAAGTPVGDKLMIPRSYLSSIVPLVREQGSERRAELSREAEAKKLEEQLAAQAERQRQSERAGDERQAEAQRMQALTQVAGEKIPVRGIEKAVISPIKELITGRPTETVQKLREQEAAKEALKTKAGLRQPNPVDAATGINTFDATLPEVNSQEEYDRLPKGTRYRDSFGNIAVK